MKFDPKHDQEELCVCGHTYYRHFDWADDYRPGCKYCSCYHFAPLQAPFPGVDVHPDKLEGELCVEGTQVTVASLLRRLSDGYTTSSAMEALGILNAPVFECLRGLADWLKTQNWTGTKPSKPFGTETGRWVCGEELAAFRAWQMLQGRLLIPERVPLPGLVMEEAHAAVAAAGPLPEDEIVKRAAEKRCGTCQFGQGDLCAQVRFDTVPDAGVRRDFRIHYLTVELVVSNASDGPPWDNCRFWKPREEKERE